MNTEFARLPGWGAQTSEQILTLSIRPRLVIRMARGGERAKGRVDLERPAYLPVITIRESPRPWVE